MPTEKPSDNDSQYWKKPCKNSILAVGWNIFSISGKLIFQKCHDYGWNA